MRKHMTRTLAAVAAAAILTLSALPDAEAGRRRQRSTTRNANLVQALEQQGKFSILLTALDTAGLTDTVANAEALTILAPTDAAFMDLLTELGISAEELLANPALGDILSYHVLAGKVRSRELVYNSINETLLAEREVLARSQNFAVYINNAGVERANLRAANGLIHILDTVLLPPEDGPVQNIVDVLELDGRFTVLLTALDQEGLLGALEDPEAVLTLFAPTDDAFVALLEDLEIGAEDLLANPALTDILLYHVAADNQQVMDLLRSGGTETLLTGESVSVQFRSRRVTVNGDSQVINTNVNAPNGVIQVIDAVLLP